MGLATVAGAAPEDWQQAGRTAVQRARALDSDSRRTRNVVLFVGDGMGVNTVTAARILAGQLSGESGEEGWLHLERLPYVALAKTYNTNQQVPDSAGTMTAMMTGVKTRAGVINLDESVPRGEPRHDAARRLETLIEQAEDRGLSTGVVSTARITHATPAACYAHIPERGWEDDATLSPDARAAGYPDIARQLVEFPRGDGLEVALGGGRAHFLPDAVRDPEHPEQTGARLDGRDLTREWLSRHQRSAYVWSRDQLEATDLAQTDHLLGLFEPSHMQFEAFRERDPAGEPSLREMTLAALEIVSRNPRGYVLVVEGGRIDHGHHVSSAYLALHEVLAMDEAVAAVLERVDLDDTLVVVTADQGHVLSFAGYPTRGNPILGKVRGNDRRGEPAASLALDGLGLPYTTLGYQNGPGYTGATEAQPEGPKHFPHRAREFQGISQGRPDLTDVDTTGPLYLQESAVPLRNETHAGGDVAVYAGGAGASLFHGVQEQSYVYHAVEAALGWDREPGLFARWWARLTSSGP